MTERLPDQDIDSPSSADGRAYSGENAARRGLSRAAVLVFFLVGLSVLALREIVLPRVNDFRDDVAAVLSRAAGVPVSIGSLRADWPGLRPRLHLSGVVLSDAGGGDALRLDRVDATLAWSSLLRWEPHFDSVVLFSPELSVQRDESGKVFVAGVELGDAAGAGALTAWLLRQRDIVILDASVGWTDHLRKAPLLQFEQFDLRVERVGGRYRFGLRGNPSTDIAQSIDLRGDLVSADPRDPTRWTGQVYARIVDAQLEGLAPWVDYPMPLSGRGALEAWFEIADGRPQSAVVDFALATVGIQVRDSLPALDARHVRGRIHGRMVGDEYSVSLRSFELDTAEGLRVVPTDVDLTLRGESDPLDAGSLQVNVLDLAVLARLGVHLPLPPSVREHVDALEPRGQLEAVHVDWHGGADTPHLSHLEARFTDIAMRARDPHPGFEGLSGELRGDGSNGRFVLRGRDVAGTFPTVFAQPRLNFDRLDVDGGWSADGGVLAFRVDRGTFENADAAGELSGLYRPSVGRRGEIDLTARLTRARGDAVWRYLPLTVNAATRDWVRTGVLGATVQDARLALQGRLDDFPFVDEDGKFLVTVALRDGRLEYARHWPVIEDIVATLRFEGPGMHIEASQGSIFGVGLREVTADVPELGAQAGELMTLRGTAEGRTADFLRFVSASPVRDRVDGFTDGMSAEGEGTLQLGLVMPLHEVDDTAVTGDFRFARNRIHVIDWLPPLEEASGRIRFTEDSFAIENARARAIGEPLRLTASTTAPGAVRFEVAGGASLRALRQHYSWSLMEHFSGTAPWNAIIDVRGGVTEVDLRSTLAGVSSSLPQPFNKRASEAWPLSMNLRFSGDARDIHARLADRFEFVFSGIERPDGFELLRGGVGVNAAARMPGAGVVVAAELDEFDLDAWRAVLGPDEAGSGAGLIQGLDISARKLRAYGHDVAELELSASTDENGWSGRIASDLMEGSFGWQAGGEGALQLRLEHLMLGRRDSGEAEIIRLLETEAAYTLPDMNIIAERFELRGLDLGRLALQARNEEGVWLLDEVSITNAEARLNGSGRWRTGSKPLTELALRFETNDIGRFLARVGYPEVVRGGTAMLSGQLNWNGIPTRIDYPSLGGSFRLDALNGQFSKLEPGVGRLLGVLSLQSLPRRLKLDFRDVFSEGFSFDRMVGSVNVSAGMLSSDDFEIAGPAARIWIAGTADLQRETQDLKVVVQPTLSESIAIGAAAGLINPVAGVIAYLAQKVMSDPIERMFAYGYAITGSWADPQVEKLPVGQGATSAEGGRQ